MQLSTITKVAISFAFGAIIGGGVISSIATLNDASDQLATDLVQSGIKISQSNYPPMVQCPPPPEPPTSNCLPPEQYQQYLLNQQNQQQQQQQNQQPPTGGQTPPPNQTQQPPQNPDPNYQPPTGQTGQNPPPGGNQPPPGGQSPNQGQNQPGQPGQFGQPGQPPFNAASAYQGPPPGSSASNLTFQQPAGLRGNPDDCFREKGGEALVAAVRSGRMTPALMSSAASCFSANFNSAPGQGQQGQGGAPGQGGQPFGQVNIFSGKFIETMSSGKPPSNDCVVKIAGEAVAEKMFGQGSPPDPTTMKKINDAGCFGPPPDGGGQPGPNGQPGAPGRQFAGPPLEVVDCLNKIPGNGDIQSGKRNPTPTEFSAGQSCYSKAGAMPFFVPPGQVPENSPLSLCAKAVIGVTDISTITPTSLTREQKQRMRACYAPSGDQAMANTQPSLPQEAADCIKKIMGETAFAQMSTGRVEPTAEQRKAGAACFQRKALTKIGELSEAAVPKTQAEALMAEVDADLVPQPTVTPPTTTEVSEDPDTSMFELTGEVADGETVDVYYNSDSSIVTAETKAGENGKKTWSTEVAYSSLSQDEEHTLYALMTKADGSAVRSPLVAFAAKAADSSTTASTGTSRNMLILYGILGLVAISLICFFVIRRRPKAVA
ncbi:MAG: hypothetical protein Q7K33_03155 [Candidatus Berkelbacteria bacterium]|nr:hypothetical protein [Candidatus Berkelbacteria bacterium]